MSARDHGETRGPSTLPLPHHRDRRIPIPGWAHAHGGAGLALAVVAVVLVVAAGLAGVLEAWS